LVSAFLDGKSIKPSMKKNSELLLPLKRQSAEPFLLDVVYEDEDVSLNALGGHIQIAYPMVDISASVTAVDIYAPDNMYFFGITGDFRKTASVKFISWKNESRRKPLIEENVGQRINAWLSKDKAQQILRQSSKVGGTLPLNIQLPKKGEKISLDAFYVPANASLKTEFFLVHQRFQSLGYGVAILLFLGMGCFIPSYPHLSRMSQLLGIVGFLILFWLIPIQWKEIFLYLLAGGVIRYVRSAVSDQ
jgi:hypothetical protein